VTTNKGIVTLGPTGCGVSRLMHVLRKRHQLLLEFVHASPEFRLGRSDGYGLLMSRASRHLFRNPVCGYLVRACWYIVCWHCSLCPSQTFFAKYCTPFESCILSLWDCGSACNGSWDPRRTCLAHLQALLFLGDRQHARMDALISMLQNAHMW
jgi:hypothetical protein